MKKLANQQIQNGSGMAHAWQLIGSNSALKRWSREISALMVSGSPEDWDLSGHGVLIEIGDTEEAVGLVRSAAIQAGINFAEFDAEAVVDSIGTLKEMAGQKKPVICYLHSGLWQDGTAVSKKYKSQTGLDAGQLNEFRNAFKSLFTNDLQGQPIIIVSAVEKLSELHVALRRAGLFDRRIEVSDLSIQQKAACFIAGLGHEKVGRSISSNLLRIGHLIHFEYKDFRRRQLCEVALRRIAWQENRKIEFADVVKMAAYGTSNFDDIPVDSASEWRTAVHEAGHALVSHVDSKKRIPPAYCGILNRKGTFGMVVPAFEGHELATNDPTFEDILHRIRVNLAGRVAEDLYLGGGQTSAVGSAEDLQRATDLAKSLVKDWGYGGADKEDNLAVFSADISQNELSRIEENAKNLLADEYLKVCRILEANQAYYNRIVAALGNKKILLPEDFEKLSADLKDLEELAA